MSRVPATWPAAPKSDLNPKKSTEWDLNLSFFHKMSFKTSQLQEGILKTWPLDAILNYQLHMQDCFCTSIWDKAFGPNQDPIKTCPTNSGFTWFILTGPVLWVQRQADAVQLAFHRWDQLLLMSSSSKHCKYVPIKVLDVNHIGRFFWNKRWNCSLEQKQCMLSNDK